ncbi:FN3 associated domain-containing protein [Planctomycetota bacterium]
MPLIATLFMMLCLGFSPMLPELRAESSRNVDPDWSQGDYLSPPTAGRFNRGEEANTVQNVEFSIERGFYDTAFQLTLSTPTPGAQIRYTLDGSTPKATIGIVYSDPLTIYGTTVIRAGAFKSDYLDSSVSTKTYIFIRDVIRQSPNGRAPGSGWPTGSVNGQVINYGMDPDIVNNPRWAGLIEDALLDIPTISLVTDLANLFDRSTGIYVNARRDGRDWERRTSVELIHPDGTTGFGLDAGLRIRGAFSRSGNNPKHAFRLFFRSEYGAGKLRYPLFGGEGDDEFDKIDLRTSQNNSWSFQGSSQNTLIRDVFSRDVQRDMGQPYTRSRYYHLYLNGHYWGLYQTQERADADFAESYLGGDKEEYDVIKNDSSGSRALHATDGTIDAYRRLYDVAVAGFASDGAYFGVQGFRREGMPDPTGDRLLDPENLMDYMICTYYTGDPDAPVSCWAHFSNNVFAIYNHVQPQGFTWYRHDAEHSLGANGGINEGRLLTDPTDRSIGQQWRNFNPAWLHLRLTAHPEYLMQFADRVNAYFWNGGLLTAAPNIERWMARANQINLAIIAESARWGDAQRHPPRTRGDWEDQNNYMVNTFFPGRTQIVIDQMRSMNMFPDLALVSFNQHGGEVIPGFELLMSQSNGTPGTIYYTLDESDPRLWGGEVNPDAAIFEDDTRSRTLISRGSDWRYKDDGSNQGTAWRYLNFNDSRWAVGPAQLGYGDGDEATVVGYGRGSSNKYATTYFRHVFYVEDASNFTELTLGIVRDDGAVVYINGVEVARINMPGGNITYRTWATGPGVPVGGIDESTFNMYDIDPDLLVDGSNVIAVEIHQVSATSSDISFDLELVGLIAGSASPPIILDYTTTVKARTYHAGQWGALTEARFTVGLEGFVINEFMASNQTTLEDPDESDEFPDWIEIYNGTPGTIDLEGMYLTDERQDLTKWRIGAGVSIDPGQYLIFYADDDGTQGVYHTNYQLSSSGETIVLVDSDGKTIIDSIMFDAQFEDVSYGRFPDGDGSWDFHLSPTPGSPNQMGHGQ